MNGFQIGRGEQLPIILFQLHNLILPLDDIRGSYIIQFSFSEIRQNLCLNNVLFCQERIAFYSRLQIRQINIHKTFKAHTDTLILFQLEVPLPFEGFIFLRKAPLGLLLPFSGQILIISPHLPHSGLFVLDNRHLSHLLICGQSVDSFHKILCTYTPFYCHESISLKFCIQSPYQLICIG